MIKVEKIKIIHKIKIWFKYKSLKVKINHKNKELYNSMKFYPESKTAFEIAKIQSRKSTSKVEYAPISFEFYISNGEKYIILKQNSISIVNGIYHYYVDMPMNSTKYLDKYFKRILERRRSKVKREIESKITRSLDDILEKLKKEEEQTKLN